MGKGGEERDEREERDGMGRESVGRGEGRRGERKGGREGKVGERGEVKVGERGKVKVRERGEGRKERWKRKVVRKEREGMEG